jgi:hypothetical protein
MTDTPATTLLAGIRDEFKYHMHVYTLNPRRDYCTSDNQNWPCDVARLLDAAEALVAALVKHRPWFVNGQGVKICAGCLEPSPCPDDPDVIVARALSGKDSSDGK